MADLDPGSLGGTRAADEFDVFLCFTPADPAGVEQVEKIEQALRDNGLRVFRDPRIDEFDSLTDRLVNALASSRVLLVHYSRALAGRYAPQWELMAAYLAASRHGDPCLRVLAINPEPDTTHLAPVQPAEADFFTGPVTAETLPRLVAQVRRKVDDTSGPLGAPARHAERTGPVPGPRPIAGRYPQLWEVHSALHSASARPVVAIRGLSGVGKTSLAEQYAHLFHGAFPGGIHRTGPFGHHAPEDLLSQYHLALAAVATGRLGLDVRGITPDRLRALVADRFTAPREKVLWLIDDVPADVPPTVLEQLLLPSPVVHTLLTSRAGLSTWDATTVDLPGLTPEEGLRLFTELRSPAGDAEHDAVLRFARRCGGHPFALRATAYAVRHLPGTLTDEDLRDRPDTAPQAIRDELAGFSPPARRVLRFAALLAPVPFPPLLVSEALGLDGSGARPELAMAADELLNRGFVDVADGGWQVHPLVTEVVRAEYESGDATRAAEVLLGWLGDGRGTRRDFLLQHARAVADRAPGHRISLLRPVAAAFEDHGDPTAAGEIHAIILATGEPGAADLVAAARVEIACGLHEEAGAHARLARTLAVDHPTRYRAGLLAAEAFDCQGRYGEADAIFWTANAGRLPDGEDRPRAVVALAIAQRRRGRPQEALALLTRVLPELRDTPGDVTTLAKLEYARNLLLSGEARAARAVAGEVVDGYRSSGRERHARCTEAELVLAESTLDVDLAELRADRASWARSTGEVEELRGHYERLHGAEHPLTLSAAALVGRALLALAKPAAALAALAATEQSVLHALGDDHPLRYRIRHGMGLAHAQLREFARQADLLEPILEPQIRLLGGRHPETLESHLDLGVALAMSGRGPRRRATALVDAAARDLVHAFGVTPELTAKAAAAKSVVRLPQPMVSGLSLVESMTLPGRKKGV